MKSSPNHSVCIVEDRSDLREVMSLMVVHTDGFELLGSYANAEEALEKIPQAEPDVVLMDINLPELSGIDCVSSLKTRFPKMLFLMCTAYEDSDKIFASLKAGASGYILKTDGPASIMSALSEVIQGGSPMSMSIARKVVASFLDKDDNKNKPLLQSLTSRENEVLEQLAKGKMNKEVAEALHISQATVRTHVQNIYSKLHVNTRVEAVNMYLRS